MSDPDWVEWSTAWHEALYGPGGFFRRHLPREHMRTSAHVGDRFGWAVAQLARRCGFDTVVDIGSGGGELLRSIHRWDADLHLVGVDITTPAKLPDTTTWLVSPGGAALPKELASWLPHALVIANEWLDTVPCAIVIADGDPPSWRLVEVDPRTGRERLAGTPNAAHRQWLHQWWTPPQLGDRAEIGLTRDAAWAGLVTMAAATDQPTVALAIDYSHSAATRPRNGTLIGYREGRTHLPVLDGHHDITAHVAMDSVATAGGATGAQYTLLTTQRDALHALGLTGAAPHHEEATREPQDYLAALASASYDTELLSRNGLGAFTWLAQRVGPDPTGHLTATLNTLHA
ncbi:MAG: SAM-dependent methyltransferase [Actinomycetota bacterium]